MLRAVLYSALALLAYAQALKDGRGIRVFDVATRNMIRDMPLSQFSDSVPKPSVAGIAISPD